MSTYLDFTRERNISDNVHGRTIYADERHCINCLNHNLCWSGSSESSEGSHVDAALYDAPDNFTLVEQTGNRQWSPLQFLTHMKGVYAQVCSNFSSRIDAEETNRNMEAAKILNDFNKKKEEGWDM